MFADDALLFVSIIRGRKQIQTLGSKYRRKRSSAFKSAPRELQSTCSSVNTSNFFKIIPPLIEQGDSLATEY